jgi:DNA helicase II / ATP-dependent DNA helicase PcrA
MTSPVVANEEAEEAASQTITSIEKCITERKSFVLEAGAGAGKTYSLVHALRFVIDREGISLRRRSQQVACITYTNVARDEIESRTDGHPAVLSATIHSFCWSLLKRFQAELREQLPLIPKWQERLDEFGEIGARKITYDLGYPSAKDKDIVTLGHSDVLKLMVALLDKAKFRRLLIDQYPIIFVDEYQDTNRDVAEALKAHFIAKDEGLLLGFFGDHWQKIYGEGCGRIEHPNLTIVEKHVNYRSAPPVVELLNQIRVELPQFPARSIEGGSVQVFHTNGWQGERQTRSPWKGDLPAAEAHQCLQSIIGRLTSDGWDFDTGTTKVLKLTHNGLADEQGYRQLADVFSYTDLYIRKEDDYIAYFADILEPVSAAYENRRFGEMFGILGGRRPDLRSTKDKSRWSNDMDRLLQIESEGTIGEVLDHLRATNHPRLPPKIDRKEDEFSRLSDGEEPEQPSWVKRLKIMRTIPYGQVRSLVKFVNGSTPFATKHGIKGQEFENVLVVVGKGWNNYNFNQMLEWVGSGIPPGKQDTFERSRNLFYVCCSRPKKRLAVLFTEELSSPAMSSISAWFGTGNVEDFDFYS